MNILAIEDDKDFAKWCEVLIRDAGIKAAPFTICDKLSDGLQYAREHCPALILLDLNLTDTQREQTVLGIPELDKLAPVVIVSGLGATNGIDPELLQLCYQAGAVGHIFKKHLIPTCSEMVAGLLVAAGYNWRRIHFPHD